MDNETFFCLKHIPDATKVGWDKEHQKEVIVSYRKKGSKSFLKKAIVNKLKKWSYVINICPMYLKRL